MAAAAAAGAPGCRRAGRPPLREERPPRAQGRKSSLEWGYVAFELHRLRLATLPRDLRRVVKWRTIRRRAAGSYW